MRLLLVILVWGLMFAPCPISAATIQVPGDQPTIQAGIEAASTGDTVLVVCGTYYEHDVVLKAGVFLKSETGEADCVTIDAEQLGRVFYAEGVGAATRIKGFTLTGGSVAGRGLESRGGGIACVGGASPTLENLVLSGNHAAEGGGGLYCDGISSPTMTACVLSGNSATDAGGGIYCRSSSSPTLNGCLITGNSSQWGGGIRCYSSCSLVLTGCTVSGNVAYRGGGILGASSCSFALENVILWANCAEESGDEVYLADAASSVDFSCCDVDSPGVEGAGVVNWLTGNIFADPRFCDPEPCESAPTAAGDHHLRVCSPCLDAPEGCGQIGALGAGSCPRIWHILPDGSGDAPTIQAGIDSACAGDTVLVASGTHYEHDISLKSGVIVRGEAGRAGEVTIDAQYLGRVFHAPSVMNAVIEGLTITKGETVEEGGGLLAETSAVSLAGCVFNQNSAVYGGAIEASDGSALTVTGCTFYDNRAEYNGGAIDLGDGTTATLENTLVFHNPSGDRLRQLAPLSCSGAGAEFTLSCCDVCEIYGEAWVGCIADQAGINGNFSAEPFFYDAQARDLRLTECSPCLDAPGCGLVGALGLARPARTWYVRENGTGDAPTIAAALDSAAHCDTVLVAAGTYNERNLFLKDALVFMSEDGPEATVIDGEGSGTILQCMHLRHYALIEGFTVTRGGGSYVAGGMYCCCGSNLTVQDCIFTRNSCQDRGGGVYSTGSNLTLRDCTISRNSTVTIGKGGGINSEYGDNMILENCLITGNSAQARGGGIHCMDAQVTLTGCTVYDNTASSGSGMNVEGTGTATLDNTIVAFNGTGSGLYCTGLGGSYALSCCDVFGNTGGDYVGCVTDQAGVNGNFSADPLFCDAPGRDFHLAPCSPCLTAPGCGPVGALGAGCPTRSWYVKADGSGDAPTIQAAIDSAEQCDTVLVAAGTYYEHNIVLKSGVYLLGETGRAGGVVVDGQDLGPVLQLDGVNSTTTIEGLTITGGAEIGGGGMGLSGSSPRIIGCHLTGNRAAVGGAMYLSGGSSPVISGCAFSLNTADNEGGAIYCQSSSPNLTDCTLSENESQDDGGGLYVADNSSPAFSGCGFSSNTSGSYGGGAAVVSSSAIFTGCTLQGNSSTGNGGGIWGNNSSLAVSNCDFDGNSAQSGGGTQCEGAGGTVTVTGCTFSHNTAIQSAGALDLRTGPAYTITGCTIYGNSAEAVAALDFSGSSDCAITGCTFHGNSAGGCGGGVVHVGSTSALRLENTIIASNDAVEGAVVVVSGGDAALECCDLHGNAGGDWVGYIAPQYGVDGNISEDPLFCGPAAADFHLDADSPCLDAPGCGLIGAWGEGCDGFPTEVEREEHPLPRSLCLGPAIPNPFNPLAEISYAIPITESPSTVSLRVYATTGRLVRVLVDGPKAAGGYSVTWDGTDHHGNPVASGVYFYRLTWNGESETKRMVLIR